MEGKANPEAIAGLINLALETSLKLSEEAGGFREGEWKNLQIQLREAATSARQQGSNLEGPWANIITLLHEGKESVSKDDPFLREVANHINWDMVQKKPQELSYMELLGEFFPVAYDHDRVSLPPDVLANLHKKKDQVNIR